MSAQIVDPSLRPVDPEVDSGSRRRVGIVLFGAGAVITLIGGFWPVIAQLFFIVGSVLVVVSLFFLKRPFRDSEANHDIRKLYRDH